MYLGVFFSSFFFSFFSLSLLTQRGMPLHPDAAGANGGGIVGKRLFNMPDKRQIAGGAMAGQDTKGTGVGGKGCWL